MIYLGTYASSFTTSWRLWTSRLTYEMSLPGAARSGRIRTSTGWSRAGWGHRWGKVACKCLHSQVMTAKFVWSHEEAASRVDVDFPTFSFSALYLLIEGWASGSHSRHDSEQGGLISDNYSPCSFGLRTPLAVPSTRTPFRWPWSRLTSSNVSSVSIPHTFR